MKIGSISENKQFEKRIAITPEVAKKYINLGFEVNLVINYGSHLGFNDNQYRDLGVKIISDEKELIHNSDLIIQLNYYILLCFPRNLPIIHINSLFLKSKLNFFLPIKY